MDGSLTHSLDYFMSYLHLSFVFQCISVSQSFKCIPTDDVFPLLPFPLYTCLYAGLHRLWNREQDSPRGKFTCFTIEIGLFINSCGLVSSIKKITIMITIMDSLNNHRNKAKLKLSSILKFKRYSLFQKQTWNSHAFWQILYLWFIKLCIFLLPCWPS